MRSLGIVVNREARRFYDEGEDFWPKRYAIWGRLAALEPGQVVYSIIDAKAFGRFMPPVFPGETASTLAELPRRLGLTEAAFVRTVEDYNAACRPGAFDHAVHFAGRASANLFAPVFAFAGVALGVGVARFWRGQAPGNATAATAREAAAHALSLRYLDGGHGEGCNEADDRFTLARRRFHHLTFYGFALCFAATAIATVYHYAFGWQAPYALASLPVLLGTFGGIGLLVGPAGLYWLGLRRHALHGDPAQKGMDRGFIALLFCTSLTGLALLAWRDSAAMALLLAVHLGCVMALFLTMPYGKFAHGFYRAAALLKWAIERRQPDRLRLGSE